jgi:3-methyladenine DNA glycosylase AlkD
MTPLPPDPEDTADRIAAGIRALGAASTAPMRAVRKRHSRELRGAGAEYVRAVARLLNDQGYDWIGWELIRHHRAAFESLDAAALEALGEGIDSWDEVDGFARILSGPAWLHGLIDDSTVHAWARSTDLWWRRAALVSTVALNMRSQGGRGDVPRTLAVCEMLAADRERMVQQALSWALRELVIHDAQAVATFVNAHESELSSQVKREVRHKLDTGLKNPRRGVSRVHEETAT